MLDIIPLPRASISMFCAQVLRIMSKTVIDLELTCQPNSPLGNQCRLLEE
jgi:hypothetical protein